MATLIKKTIFSFENFKNNSDKFSMTEAKTTNANNLWSLLDGVYEDFIALYTLMDEGVIDADGKLAKGKTMADVRESLESEDLGSAFSSLTDEAGLERTIAAIKIALKHISESK